MNEYKILGFLLSPKVKGFITMFKRKHSSYQFVNDFAYNNFWQYVSILILTGCEQIDIFQMAKIRFNSEIKPSQSEPSNNHN